MTCRTLVLGGDISHAGPGSNSPSGMYLMYVCIWVCTYLFIYVGWIYIYMFVYTSNAPFLAPCSCLWSVCALVSNKDKAAVRLGGSLSVQCKYISLAYVHFMFSSFHTPKQKLEKKCFFLAFSFLYTSVSPPCTCTSCLVASPQKALFFLSCG